MSLQDLTPQLRTRLSRVERMVGVFVILATLLLLTGFVYYVYHTAERKGWFTLKVPYYTLMNSAEGVKVGDPVMLMGFPAGEITRITPNDPNAYWNVTIEFVIRDKYFGYVWTDSRIKVGAAGFLGGRFVEVTKGGTSGKEGVKATYKTKNVKLDQIWIDPEPDKGITGHYAPFETYASYPKAYWILADESPPLTEQLSRVVTLVEQAMPNVLGLTNQVTAALTNSAGLVTALRETLVGVRPIVTNLSVISDQLRNPHGSLGEWLIPTQVNQQLQGTLTTANATVQSAQTNLTLLSSNVNLSLLNLADLTSNLNSQVQANSLILSELSLLVVNADDLVQGLKRNWLLKSSFKPTTNPPVESVVNPSLGGAR